MAEPLPCATEVALQVLGGRWRVIVLAHLKEQPLHHAALRRRIPGISQKMLTQRLRELEAEGLVSRTPEAQRVIYRLTPRGEQLRPVLQALYDFGTQWAAEKDIPLQTPDQVVEVRSGSRQ